MPANGAEEETVLLEAALAWLRGRLPQRWDVSRSSLADAAIEVKAPNGTYTPIAVEAKAAFAPRDAQQLLMPGVARTMRELGGRVPLLVVAPWLGGRTRDLLADGGINYIDLTGNALLQLDNPAVYLLTTGAQRNPGALERGRARVRGPKAARLVRLLADVAPPYGVRQIAAAAGVAPGYVSRLLDALDREALIDRSSRGRVEAVDVAGLLRRWTESYDVLASNAAQTYVSRDGARAALEILQEAEVLPGKVGVTGSFAAARLRTVAAPALLTLYCDSADGVAEALGLFEVDEGGDVVLLHPFDDVVWARGSEDGAISWCAPSQIAVDCLTGPGRMPAEGEAVLEWLAEDERAWRRTSIADVS